MHQQIKVKEVKGEGGGAHNLKQGANDGSP